MGIFSSVKPPSGRSLLPFDPSALLVFLLIETTSNVGAAAEDVGGACACTVTAATATNSPISFAIRMVSLSIDVRQLEIAGLRLGITEREAHGAAARALEKLRARDVIRIDAVIERNREVIARRKTCHLVPAILVGPAPPEVPARLAPSVAILRKDDRRII